MSRHRTERIRGGRLRIVEQKALTLLLTELMNQKGTQEQAALAIGIHQGNFSKLLNGGRSEISYGTWIRIGHALGWKSSEHGLPPGPDWDSFDPSPAEIERHMRGARFPDIESARRDLDRLVRARLTRERELHQAFRRCVFTMTDDFVWCCYEEHVMEELEDNDAGDLLADLWEDSECRPILSHFLQTVGRDRDRLPAHADLGCSRALDRVVAPFVGALVTWGVEPSFDEMRQRGELGGYLRLALKAQEMLLRPRRDWERVKRAQPPELWWQCVDQGTQDEEPEG